LNERLGATLGKRKSVSLAVSGTIVVCPAHSLIIILTTACGSDTNNDDSYDDDTIILRLLVQNEF
jgi:hypothetical protein